MLKLGGYINILIAIAHLVGLFWAEQMYEVTGIGNEMKKLAQTNFYLPYVLTITVAILFFIFGLYGLSADNKFRKLPFIKTAIFSIAGIYLFRSFGELILDNIQDTNSTTETIYSILALFIGFLFLFGGFRKFQNHKNINQFNKINNFLI